jgi:hypothetical protein
MPSGRYDGSPRGYFFQGLIIVRRAIPFARRTEQ